MFHGATGNARYQSCMHPAEVGPAVQSGISKGWAGWLHFLPTPILCPCHSCSSSSNWHVIHHCHWHALAAHVAPYFLLLKVRLVVPSAA
jgi:hypothetical protein